MPDWGMDDEFEQIDNSKPADREIVPEGDHDFLIKEVIDHGEKVEVRLVHDDRRYGWVFARTPKAKDWGKRILSTLRQALGMTREEWAAAPITDLVGRRVRARIYHKAGDGVTWVNVAEFAAVERDAAPAIKAKPRRAAVARPADDDIPF